MRPVWRLLGASGDGQPVHSQCYRVQQLLQSATECYSTAGQTAAAGQGGQQVLSTGSTCRRTTKRRLTPFLI